MDCGCECNCNCSTIIQKGDIGPPGTNGTNGINGENGDYGGFSRMWKFDTDTSVNPASTYLRFNNSSNYLLTTSIYINTTDVDFYSLPFLEAIQNSGNFGLIKLFKEYDSNKYVMFNVTNYSITGTYVTLTVSYIWNTGNFSMNDNVVLSFTPRGPIVNNFLNIQARYNEIPLSPVGVPPIGGANIMNGTILVSSFVFEENDPLNAYNLGTGIWTAPSNGYYDISFLVSFPKAGFSPFNEFASGYILAGITHPTISNVYCSDMVFIDGSAENAPDEITISGSNVMRKIAAGTQMCVRVFNRTGYPIATSEYASFLLNIKLIQRY